jgi:uncharacterized membrane protein YfcA
MTSHEGLFLLVAGVAAGLCGSIAGLASLVSYPALLAVGLSPTTANVTNTVALLGSFGGAVAGSGPELDGQWRDARRLLVAAVIGGAVGASLLLVTPESTFERIVPWLIAGASLAMLAPRRGTRRALSENHLRPFEGLRLVDLAMVAVVAVYGGYFGAGAGVMLLALLLHITCSSLPRANAVKTATLGAANVVAAVGFALLAAVEWGAAVPLGLGLVVGGRIGPVVVRSSPAGPLRVFISIAGIGLAIKLATSAYQ